MSASILIVDDDKAFRIASTALLEDRGYAIRVAPSATAALPILAEQSFDLVLSDLVMENMNGIELLRRITELYPDTTVIMVTGFGSIHTAVEAMRLGAFDYVTKPCDNEELVIKIARALESRRKERELRRLREELRSTYQFSNIVSRSEKMRAVFSLVRKVADTDVTALVLGETGTGKELVARAIHYNSARRGCPFVVINCSALPETLLESELFGHEKNAFTGALKQRIGKFEEAHGGTVFLDEIGDVPLHIQTKLLRVLQERELQRVGGNETISVDARVIAATHRDLPAMMRAGTFREDLYYRLNEFPILLPPLRERSDDIPLLAEFFLGKHAPLSGGRVRGIAPAALTDLMRHEWRGNVRELENVMKRAVITAEGDTIARVDVSGAAEYRPVDATAAAVPRDGVPRDAGDLSYKDYIRGVIADAESRYLTRVLEQHKGNISAVADLMEIDRKTVYRKLEEYGIDPSRFR